MRSPTSASADEGGAAVVWSLALVSLLLTVGLVTMALAAQVLARQRAATAADVAALVAAQALDDPCGSAGASAAANGPSLTACGQDGLDVVVEVTMPAPAVVARLLTLLGR